MEDNRCGRSREIAESFDIEVSDTDPFWKDRTFLELNYAVSTTKHGTNQRTVMLSTRRLGLG